jgi:hypothetical protein
MYITNPTPGTLERWFKTNRKLGGYLIEKLGINVIYIDPARNYYFVNNQLLKDALSKLPIWYKLIKKF